MMRIFNSLAKLLSRFLSRHPRLIFSLQHGWLKVGFALFDLKMADWVIRRPEWLRVKSSSSPKVLEPDLPEMAATDLRLAGRIVSMARSLRQQDDDVLIPADSIWGTLRERHYAELIDIVARGDEGALAQFQQKLFRSGCVNGYAYGSTFENWPHRWHYLPVQIELSAIQLAESIGLLRAECHEQGEIAFWRLLFSEEELMDRIESFFGFRVEQPRFGDPRGILFGGRFLSRETCSHLYSAHRIKSAILQHGMREPLRIIEIGGGFGGMCYWLRKVLGDQLDRYVIVDLPEVGLVQASFLGATASDDLVLHGESRCDRSRTIELFPHFLLNEIDLKPNVLINQDSMPEMPEFEVVRYLDWASRNVRGLFVSFNQETYSAHGGTLQVSVPEVVLRFPQFQRISRNTSWDRRGYVEEVYAVDASRAASAPKTVAAAWVNPESDSQTPACSTTS